MMQADNPFSFQLDGYNVEDPFAIKPAAFIGTFRAPRASMAFYDGKTDWTPEQADEWNKPHGDCQLSLSSTSKPCDYQNPHTYLEIEKAHLTGKRHQTCGGRMMNEDVLDATANFAFAAPPRATTTRTRAHRRRRPGDAEEHRCVPLRRRDERLALSRSDGDPPPFILENTNRAGAPGAGGSPIYARRRSARCGSRSRASWTTTMPTSPSGCVPWAGGQALARIRPRPRSSCAASACSTSRGGGAGSPSPAARAGDTRGGRRPFAQARWPR